MPFRQPPDMRESDMSGGDRVSRIAEVGPGQRFQHRWNLRVLTAVQIAPEQRIGFCGELGAGGCRLLARRRVLRDIATPGQRDARGNERHYGSGYHAGRRHLAMPHRSGSIGVGFTCISKRSTRNA